MNYLENYKQIKATIPANVKIVAVSKTKPAALIEALYLQTGHTIFGENKVQELMVKQKLLPSDIDWHFIGHLQTNKIKFIAPYIGLIQSVDSLKLLTEINKEAIKCNRVIPCLLQFHIAREAAKFGFSIEEAIRMMDDNWFHELSNISIQGVMGMATYTDDYHLMEKEFKTLFKYFHILKSSYFSNKLYFREISMGMTADYQLAIDEGSTIVRIGSGIFG